MTKARQIAEDMAIELQPSQMGYVPTAPPRSSSMAEEPEEDVNTTPILIDRNNRSRQKNALKGIKRKFESRYGKVDEALTPEQQAAIRKMQVEKFKKERLAELEKQPKPSPGESYGEYLKRRKMQVTKPSLLYPGQEVAPREPKNYKEWARGIDKGKEEEEKRRRAEAARYRAEIEARRRKNERPSAPKQYGARTYGPEQFRKEQEQALTQKRQEYLSGLKSGNIPSQYQPERGFSAQDRGLLGLGKQKEADKIARAVIHKTQMKNVKITPYGSGMRVEIKISKTPKRPDEPGDVELYLQRQLKTVLFTRSVATVPRIYLANVIGAIIEATPQDWQFAVDPFFRQKSQRARDIQVSTGAAVLLYTLKNKVGEDRLSNRQDFNRINRDHMKRERSSQTEPPAGGLGAPTEPGTHKGRAEYIGPEEEEPGSYAWYEKEREKEYEREKERQRKEEIERAKAASGVHRQWQKESPEIIQTSPYEYRYQGVERDTDDQNDFYARQAVGGMFGGVDSMIGGYTPPVSRETYKTAAQTKKEAEEARRQKEQEAELLYGGEFPSFGGRGERYWNIQDPDMGGRPGTPKYAEAEWRKPGGKRGEIEGEAERDMPTYGDEDLVNAARKDSTAKFTSKSPAVQLINKKMKQAFGSTQVLDAGTSPAKVIIRSPGIEAVLTRKRHTSASGAKIVTLEFHNLNMNKWEHVFSQIPNIAFPPIMATNPGATFKVVHKTNITPLIKEVEVDPKLMGYMVDYLEKWVRYMLKKGSSTITGGHRLLNWREKQAKKAQKNKNETLASVILKTMSMNEQGWYTEFVEVAKAIQDWMLKHVKTYQITSDEIHSRFDDEYNPEAVTKAIEILRANAAIYPMTNNVYMINMSRLSSALL